MYIRIYNIADGIGSPSAQASPQVALATCVFCPSVDVVWEIRYHLISSLYVRAQLADAHFYSRLAEGIVISDPAGSLKKEHKYTSETTEEAGHTNWEMLKDSVTIQQDIVDDPGHDHKVHLAGLIKVLLGGMSYSHFVSAPSFIQYYIQGYSSLDINLYIRNFF